MKYITCLLFFLFKRKHLNKSYSKLIFVLLLWSHSYLSNCVLVPGLIQCFTQGWKNRYKSCNVSESKQSSAFCSHPNTWCLSPYQSLILWPHCSLTAPPILFCWQCVLCHPHATSCLSCPHNSVNCTSFTPDTAVVSFHLLMPFIQILQLQLATSLVMCGEPSSSS